MPRAHLAGPIDDAKAAWDGYVAELASKEQAMNELEARAQWVKADGYLDDATLADLDKVIADVQSARSRVFGVIDAVRKVGDWWTRPSGGATWQPDVGMAGLGKMGALGLIWLAPIPLAALTAAIAVLVAVLRSGNPVVERAEQMRQTVSDFVAQGMTPEQAVAAAERVIPRSQSLGDGLSNLGLWIALAVGAFILMR